MAQGLNDIFGNKDQYLDEVIILPVGRYSSGTYNLPAGYVWADFEYVECYSSTATTIDTGRSVQIGKITKELIATNPINWSVQNRTTGSTEYVTFEARSATTLRVSRAGNDDAYMVKGYLKNYATKNVSAIINVNGGANVAVNKRYEIDIATELGADYVGKDLIVKAEIYINGIWAENGLESVYVQASSDFRYQGVDAQQINDKIHVITGGYGATQNGSDFLLYNGHTNHFLSPTDVTSAPCRIKVWKVDQFITNTAGSGGGGKTTLYEGTAVGHGATVPLSDSILKYDDIRIYSRWSARYTFVATIDSDELIKAKGATTLTPIIGAYDAAHYVCVSNATNTSLTVEAAGTQGIYKVVGINYSS